MQKKSWIIFLLFLIIVFCSLPAFADEAAPLPPPITEPPDVVVVPSNQYPDQYVYMVPGMAGVYAYQGIWYRNYRGYWFLASSYDCAWVPIAAGFVPPIILGIPVDYILYLPPTYHRIHYWEYHNHWRRWARERHWHRQAWYKRPGVIRDRNVPIKQYSHRKEIGKTVIGKGSGRDITTKKIGKKPAIVAKQVPGSYNKDRKSPAGSANKKITAGGSNRKSPPKQNSQRQKQNTPRR